MKFVLSFLDFLTYPYLSEKELVDEVVEDETDLVESAFGCFAGDVAEYTGATEAN